MRILVSGHHNPHFVTITEYIERAVRSLGHRLVVFEDRRHLIPGRLRRRWALLQRISVATINRALVRLVERTRPDLVLVTGGHRITRHALEALCRRGIPVVLWTTDPPKPSAGLPQTARFYHAVFCQGSEAVQLLRAQGIAALHWLPMACDPEIHRPAVLDEETARGLSSPVVFVGSFYPHRAELLRRVAHCGLSIWGPGWSRLAVGDPLRACVRGAGIGPAHWVRIYSAAKVVLSIHYRSEDERIPVYQASPRVFEALACGAFLLTDRQPDVLALFQDGVHLAAFSDGQDLKRQILHYLDRPAERRRIAATGRREVLRHHTYAHRIVQMLARLNFPEGGNGDRSGVKPASFCPGHGLGVRSLS